MAEFIQDQMQEEQDNGKELVSWITSRTNDWRDYRDTNYLEDWAQYERFWRGEWASEDKNRDSERSKIISPMTLQAVESYTAEIDEAVFGSGNFFDIEDNWDDEDKTDIEIMKNNLTYEFKKNKIRYVMQEVELLAAVYGTGIVELMVKEKDYMAPATQPIPGTAVAAVGTMQEKRFVVEAKSVNPRNFLIDPNADDVNSALGCAIERYVSMHTVVEGIEKGIYNPVKIEAAPQDSDLESFTEDVDYQKDKVKLLKYYGLVPREYLRRANGEKDAEEEGEIVELFEDSAADDFSDLVEAIVVIANDGQLLKAEENPYMMKDRPVEAFRCDIVPGRFWGVGIVEKGANMQRAIDGQLRAHLDNLALTTAPMMAIDATRMPRGASYSIRPGKTILTNGNPNEILAPMKFGQTDAANAAQAREFERMFLQATGTMDTSQFSGGMPDGAKTGAVSMMLGTVLKKHKRTITTFQETFLIPLINKFAYRYMQFAPDRFPAQDFSFCPTGTLGIVAREIEQTQLVSLLQTMSQESPAYNIVLKAIIQNSNVSFREQLVQELEQAIAPSPEAQQMQMQQQELAMQNAQLAMAKTQAEVQKLQSEAQQNMVETQMMPQELQLKAVQAASTNLRPETTDDFEKRVKVADLMLREKDIDSNLAITQMQMAQKRA
jgi:hypothetical protein